MAGVMGWPVMHSRSPLMHNYWMEQQGLAGTYVFLAISSSPNASTCPPRSANPMRSARRKSQCASINNPEMAKRLTDVLGDRPAALMKAHGAATTGKSIVDAFVLMNYLEDNAYRQYMSAQIGKPYAFSEEEIAMCREKLWNENLFKRTWDHFSAKLDAGS